MLSDPWDFHGAKVAILVGDQIVTLLRDDTPTIPWPGFWDLPGGARDGSETPVQCVLRETEEELGIGLSAEALNWGGAWPLAPSHIWFFVAECPDFDPASVRFGDEGARWALAPLKWYMQNARAIPSQRQRLAAYLDRRSVIQCAVVSS